MPEWNEEIRKRVAKLNLAPAQAQAEMDAIAAQQAKDDPQTHEGWIVWLTPLFNQIVGQTGAV